MPPPDGIPTAQVGTVKVRWQLGWPGVLHRVEIHELGPDDLVGSGETTPLRD